MIYSLLLMLFLVDEPPALDTGGRLSPNQAGYDVKGLRLDVEFFPEKKTIAGRAELELDLLTAGMTSIELDLYADLKVTEARIDGQLRPFKRVHHKLFVGTPHKMGKRIVVRIDYQGTPKEAVHPPWDGGVNWSRTDAGEPWIGVSCQGLGGQVWYPCKAHPSDKIEGVALRITVPEPLYCAANGLLDKIEPAGPGKRTFHWTTRYPISNYNLSVNIADYEIHQRTWKGARELPIIFYVLREYQKADQLSNDPRDYAQKKKDLLDQTIRYLEFMNTRFAPYPWMEEKLGIVHTAYLGMEHQTINSYGAHFRQNNGVDDLLLHELAHEWWGNMLSVADWGDAWLHEGFATYTEVLYREHLSGVEAAAAMRLRTRAMIRNRMPMVRFGSLSSKVFGADIYKKGALVLHTLRYLMEDAPFNALLTRFASLEGYVTTDDFASLAESLAKKDLDWFFQRYCHKADLPELKVHQEQGFVSLDWGDPDFNMPMEVALIETSGTRYQRLLFSNGKTRLELPAGVDWKLDPRHQVLKRVAH